MVPFQSVNKKYYIQKKIIVQMEEKLMMSLQQPQGTMGHTTCSPDTDRTGETEVKNKCNFVGILLYVL